MIDIKITNFYHFYPCLVTLVGAQQGAKINYMAAAWNVGLSFHPPLFGVAIAPQRYTHGMIVKTGEFTCNFLSMDFLETIHGTGRVSGRDVDKVDAFQIPLEDSKIITCPTIADAYAAYECRVKHQYPVGDHDLFVGEIAAIHSNPQLIRRDGLLDPQLIDFTLYMGSNTYLSTDSNRVVQMPAEIELNN
ncbi:MAG: flavin reductase family protein [Fidelibacterota bacterium]